jgi:hypothetical protein
MKIVRVVHVLKVDHPENRDSTFRPVPAGTTIFSEEDMPYAAAVRYFEALRSGQWDSSSEYVKRVQVIAKAPNGLRWTTVRRQISRDDRGQPWRHE